MPASDSVHPFSDDFVSEVPLADSPLQVVLFQIRFQGPLTRMRQALSSGRLQDALASDYEYVEEGKALEIVIQPGKQEIQPQQTSEPVWSLRNEEGDWKVDLATSSFSLLTQNYVSRADFKGRARALLTVIHEEVGPKSIARLGVRYLNRVAGSDILEWHKTLTTPAQGALADSNVAQTELLVQLSELQYIFPNGMHLKGRWGVLPPNATIDAALPAVADKSWILDIDVFTEGTQVFDVDPLADSIERSAQHAYQFFRWAVPASALERFSPRITA